MQQTHISHDGSIGYKLVVRLTFAVGLLCTTSAVTYAQALPAASRAVPVTAFALSGGDFTGLGGFGATAGLGGRNIPITVGVAAGAYQMGAYSLAAEARGQYPISSGHVDGQKSLLGGLRLGRSFQDRPTLSRLHVYGDVLAGRGSLSYVNGGYPVGSFVYLRTPSIVFGGGGGFEISFGNHWGAVADAQVQHWDTPVTQAHIIYSKSGLVGIAYHF